MTSLKNTILFIIPLFIFTLILNSSPSLSQDAIAQIKTLSGTADVVRNGASLPLSIGSKLFQKDVVKTSKDGKLGITFIDNSMFSLGSDSELALEKFRFNTTTYKGQFQSSMKRGTLAAVSGRIAKNNPGQMSVKTPSAILGVRGTKFVVEVEGE